MKIYGFGGDGITNCSGDTRFLTDEELLQRLNVELDSANGQIDKLEKDMYKLAELHSSYRYDIASNVGRCFIEMDSVNSIIRELQSKINRLKAITEQ